MQSNHPFLSISEVVDEYLASNFNNDQKFYENYLIHAKWIYKKLFKDTLYEVKSKHLPIDYSTTPASVEKPRDLMKFFGLSLLDHRGKLVHLDEQERMNTTPLPSSHSRACKCKQCSCSSSLCGVDQEFTVTTNSILIDGQTYVEKIWNKICDNGDVLEVKSTPVKDYYDATHYQVKFIDQENYIGKLDVKPCGCIRETVENRTLIFGLAGYFVRDCSRDFIWEEHFDTEAGYFKMGTDGRIYLKALGKDITHVQIFYQTNGQCPYEEIMIPEFAVDAMHFGIHYRVKALSSGVARLEAREIKRMFYDEVDRMEEYLQPVRMDEFLHVQGIIPKWGGGHAQEGNRIVAKVGLSQPVTIEEVSHLLDQKLAKIAVAVTGGGSSTPPIDPGPYAFVFYQNVPSMKWVIKHNLQFYPSVTTVNEQGEVIDGDVKYISQNQIEVTFSQNITGFAYLS